MLNILRKIKTGVDNNDGNAVRFFWNYCVSHGLTNPIPDKQFVKLNYRIRSGKKLNLQRPISFNEKMQWLKLYDRRPEYTVMADKYEVKKYAANTIGADYIIPTLGVWDSFDGINFDKLPNQFVLKCTHDSGGLFIVQDKTKLNIEEACKKLTDSLNTNYYKLGREWPYKDVPRRIIAEEYLTDKKAGGLMDYKVFNFNGVPKLIQVDYDRFTDHKRNLYSVDWEFIDAQIQFRNDALHMIPKPEALEEMLDAAGKLSAGYPHIRTDFYCIDSKVYFGELTIYHGSGLEKFTPEELGIELGSYIELPAARRQGGGIKAGDES